MKQAALVIVLILAISLYPRELTQAATAGTLQLLPACGTPGAAVSVTGSGWETISEEYEYRLFFDTDGDNLFSPGEQVAQQSPDVGLFEQPNMSFTIPNGAILGSRKIRNELRRTADQAIIVFAETTFDVSGVQVLEFEAINSPLDNNPNAGGGERVFPDKQSATDTIDRKRVRVKATVGCPNVTVFFRSFDVDDPSSNTNPIDPNGSDGNDNRGAPQNGTLSAASAVTDDFGVAGVESIVTMQPGDNFKIAASTDSAYLNGVVIDGVNLKNAAGNTLPTDTANATSMLTVWRRVHIEMDSMGFVTGNSVMGTVQSAWPSVAQNRTRLNVDQVLEDGRFENGGINIIDVGFFPVIVNIRRTILIRGTVRNEIAAGKSFTLVDDDDFNSDDGSLLDGDDDEDVTNPDTSHIQNSDNPAQNVFAPAYVRPIYDIGDNNGFVSFLLNEVSDRAADLIATYDFDSVGTEADNEFWTVYLLGAYQHTTPEDNDPGEEGATLGIVDNINGQGASVFNEILRAGEIAITAVVNNAATTAHEIGHLFNGLHSDGGLMAQSSARTTMAFSDETLAKIRSLNHP